MARIEFSDEQYARLLEAATARGLTPVGWILSTVLDSDAEHRDREGVGFLSDGDRTDLMERVEQERLDPPPQG